jgi:rRNA maturation protein Nop10
MGDTKCSGRRHFATACIFGALTVLCAPAKFSQTLTTGYIAGLVQKDTSGAVVPTAMVTLKYTVKTIGRSRGGLLYTFRSEIPACPVCGAVAKFRTF